MNESDVRVSVLLPTYNRADILPRAIESVLAQTFRDFELLVVDDGSTDDTEEIVESYDDDRIRYVRLEKNRGSAPARNVGIERSRGEFVAFQDSDDEWKARKLEKQVRRAESNPEAGVVYTGFRRISGDVEQYVPDPAVGRRTGDLSQQLLKYNLIDISTSLVRSEYLTRVGGLDERMPLLQDWDLWIRISEHTKFELVDEPLVNVHLQADSMSNDHDALIEAKTRLLEKHERRFRDLDPETLSVHLFRLGRWYLQSGDPDSAREYLQDALGQQIRPAYLAYYLQALLASVVRG